MAYQRVAKPNPRRMLVLLSWLNSAGPTTLGDLAARFQCSEAEVLADLDKAMMTGLPPFTDDCLVTYFRDEDTDLIEVSTPPEFGLPLRLTEYEAFSLIAAARAFNAGAAFDDPVLSSAAKKIERHLGVEGQVVVNDGRPAHLPAVVDAKLNGRRVQITYLRSGDGQVERLIDPHEVIAADGRWYTVATDVAADTVKRYRVDRILAVEDAGPADDADVDVPVSSFVPDENSTEVRVRFPVSERWVVQRYPATDVTEDDEFMEATLMVGDRTWLARLVLRAHAVVTSPGSWADASSDLIEEIAAVYR